MSDVIEVVTETSVVDVAGNAGRGFTSRGPWAAGASYAPYDVVTDGGQTFENTVATAGSTPPAGDAAHWRLWAAKGADGASGNDALLKAQNLADLPSAPAARANLGLGTAATHPATDFDAAGAAAAALASALAASQPLDADLTAIAALSTTTFGRSLLALADAAAGRTALGLGSAATSAVGDFDAAGAAAAAQAASQPLDSDLTAIAALSTTSYGRAFLALADAAAGRTALGLGTAATSATTAFDAAGTAAAAQAASQPLDSDLTAIAALSTTPFGRSLLAAADAAAVRTAIGTVIGTDVQAHDAELDALAGLTSAADKLPYFTGSGTAAVTTLSAFIRTLLDDGDAATARTTVGLGNVDNTSDVNKPVSTAQQTALRMALFKPAAASTPQGTLPSDPFGPVTLVADGRHNAFPGLAVTNDGILVVAYRSGTNHAAGSGTSRAYIAVIRSLDGGATWSAATTAYLDPTLDSRDPTLFKMPDGSLFCTFATENVGGSVTHALVMKSTDGGVTWGAPVSLNTGYTGWDYITAPVVRLSNATLLAPVYAVNTGDTFESASVVKSTDGGATWGNPVKIANGPVDSKHYTEPFIVLLDDGSLLCLIRELTGTTFYKSTSTDNGATWSAPVTTIASMSGRPAAIQINSGAVVVVARQGTGVQQVVSYDRGVTWSAQATIATTSFEMAYAQMVEVSRNVVGLVYAVEPADFTYSNLYFTYLLGGFGTTPLGWLRAEPQLRRVDIDVFSKSAHSNWDQVSVDTGLVGNAGIAAGTGTDGSYREWQVVLSRGSYTIDVMYWQFTDQGKVDFKINGTTVGQIDMGGVSAKNRRDSSITFTQAQSGLVLVRTQINGKSAGTNYNAILQRITLRRTDII